MVPNIRLYKLSKVAIKEFPVIIRHIEVSIKNLKAHNKYLPVKALLKHLEEELKNMKKGLAKMQKVYERKGVYEQED